MATINFYLDRPDSKGRYPIFLVCQHKGRKFRQFTKEKILPKYWDTSTQKAKRVAGAAEINDYLEELKERLRKLERELRRTDPQYTFDDLKDIFQEKDKKHVLLFDFIEQHMEGIKSSHKRKTIQEFKTILNDLKDYEKHYSTTLTYQKINKKFFNNYLAFLVNERKNVQNTIAKKISTLKTLLKEAEESGYNNNSAYQKFEAGKIKTKKVYLTKAELKSMIRLDLTNNPRLERVRDIFCFGCFTGLRYSDIKNLKYAEIVTKYSKKEKRYKAIDINVQKTKDPLEIPLNNHALTIIHRYEKKTDMALAVLQDNVQKSKSAEQVLPNISIQKMNDYIKEVAALAGINTEVNVVRHIGSKRIDKVYKKFELIATHAARRTFAILSLKQGMNIEVLQQILGHSRIKTTMDYVFVDEETKNKQMKKAWKKFKL